MGKKMLQYIYISELPEPICLQMGKGEKEVVITIYEDGIYYVKTTFS